jgi:hypothetical protein
MATQLGQKCCSLAPTGPGKFGTGNAGKLKSVVEGKSRGGAGSSCKSKNDGGKSYLRLFPPPRPFLEPGEAEEEGLL